MPRQFRQVGVPDPRRIRTAHLNHVRRARRRTETLLNRKKLPAFGPLLTRIDAIQQHVQLANDLVQADRLGRADSALETLCASMRRNVEQGVGNNGNVTSSLMEVYRQLTRLLVDAEPQKKRAERNEGTDHLRRFLREASERGWRVSADRPPRNDADEQDGFDRSVSFIRSVAIGADTTLPEEENFGLIRAPLLLLKRVPEHVLYRWTQPPANYKVYVVLGYYALILDALFVGVNSRLLWVGSPERTELDMSKFDDIISFMSRGTSIPTKGMIPQPKAILGHHYCPVLTVDDRHRRYFTEWDIPRN